MSNYLYKGISKEKYKNDGKQIIPRMTGDFNSSWNLDEGHSLNEGLTLDKSEENATVLHQKDSTQFPTSGISTTPVYERAKHYATHGGIKDGYVFTIDRNKLKGSNITEHIVLDYTDTPKVPEDKEVILVAENGGALPEKVIIKKDEIKKS